MDNSVIISTDDLYSVTSSSFPSSAGIPVWETYRADEDTTTEEERQCLIEFLEGIE